MLTTYGTYSCSLVTQIVHSGQPSHGGNRKTSQTVKVCYEVIGSSWTLHIRRVYGVDLGVGRAQKYPRFTSTL